MLFASTRLTLVRELGIERFRETLFVTEASELTPEGWARHEKHTAQEAPLTEEEAGQAGLREAEAQESGGTTARKGHVSNKTDALKKEEGLDQALGELMKAENKGLLLQLVSTCPDEARIPAAADLANTEIRPPRRNPPPRLHRLLRLSFRSRQHSPLHRPTPELLLLSFLVLQRAADRLHLHLSHDLQDQGPHDVLDEQALYCEFRGTAGWRGDSEELGSERCGGD